MKVKTDRGIFVLRHLRNGMIRVESPDGAPPPTIYLTESQLDAEIFCWLQGCDAAAR